MENSLMKEPQRASKGENFHGWGKSKLIKMEDRYENHRKDKTRRNYRSVSHDLPEKTTV